MDVAAMAVHASWLDTPTRFWSQVQSCPAPMNDAPKHSPLIALVAKTAIHGTLFRFNFAKNIGAWRSTASEYINLVPANSAWFPAEMTEVMMTALMNEPAALAPAIWKTIVNGEVDDFLVERFG